MNSTKSVSIATLLLISFAGCTVNRQGDAKWEDPFFRPPGETSHVVRIFKDAEAKGVAADATLTEAHFGADGLNSLGKEFLGKLLDAPRDESSAVEVFLDLPKDDARLTARTDAVKTFLADAGVAAEDVIVTRGTNPANTIDAARSLHSLGASAAAD